MIYPLAGLVIGALIGALLAKRHEGNTADMAQWGAVGALILGVIGLFVLVFIERAHFNPADQPGNQSGTEAEAGPETNGETNGDTGTDPGSDTAN